MHGSIGVVCAASLLLLLAHGVSAQLVEDIVIVGWRPRETADERLLGIMRHLVLREARQ